MSDSEYIKSLEWLVNSFARSYQTNFDKFYWKNFETCSVGNPNRRDLIPLEKDILMRFTTYQGRFRDKVKDIASLDIEAPAKISEAVAEILKKHGHKNKGL